MEHVNHPKHYNQHPAGIECIEIIRHYTCDIANAIKYLWRAGLKPEMGKEDAEKEIEDLHKALWYIEDYRVKIPKLLLSHFKTRERMTQIVIEVAGHAVYEIAYCGYDDNVANAIGHLLCIGIIRQGEVRVCERWEEDIRIATESIQARILKIESSLLDKEVKSLRAALDGQAVDGENYVSKPACIRETEPEKYDPLNMIVAWGRVYSLADEVRKKGNGALYEPCQNCDLWSECHDWKDTPNSMLEESKCHYLCTRIHNASEQQYYREVGIAKYSPSFGNIEVVDEMKEAKVGLRSEE